MSAAAVPAMNKFVLGKMSQGQATPTSSLETESGFNMGYAPMTSGSLERTLAAVSDQVSQKAREFRMATQSVGKVASTAAQSKTARTYGEAK